MLLIITFNILININDKLAFDNAYYVLAIDILNEIYVKYNHSLRGTAKKFIESTNFLLHIVKHCYYLFVTFDDDKNV